MSPIRLPFNPDLHALCHCLALLPFNTSYLGTCFLRPRISHFSDVSFKLPKTGMHCIFPTYQIFLRTTLLLKAWTWYPSSLEMDICLCKYNNSVQLHTKWLITASYFVFLFFFNFSSFSATWIWSWIRSTESGRKYHSSPIEK